MSDLLKKVSEFIRENGLLDNGDHVILAVSGGADSVCLLELFTRLKESMDLELKVIHIHHGLRGEEADRDAAFVMNLAAERGICCSVLYEDVSTYARASGMSEEEAGRFIRYRAFEEEAVRWSDARVATGHHEEDQAETILFNLFRGSSLKGLGGISPKMGRIIRPLLCAEKKEILEYLEELGTDYCTDSTNLSDDHTRNRIRNGLMPQITKEINAKAVRHIASAGAQIALADEYFEEEAEKILSGNAIEGPDSIGIKTEVLNDVSKIIKGYVIRGMIKRLKAPLKDVTSVHIDNLIRLAGGDTGKRIDLPHSLVGWTQYNVLWISVKDQAVKVDTPPAIPVTMTRFPYDGKEKIPQKRYTKWFDYDKIKNTLSVRTRQTGDYITLKDGKKKTVKAFMIDEKIPRQERDKILLLADGDHILWIIGYRISEYYKVTDDTREILQVQADGGEEYE